MNMDCIVSKDLSFNRGSTPILRDLNFSLPGGTLIGLIGHNGAGKSTLIKLILGLIQPKSGVLTVLGGKPGTQPLRVGYLPENVSFYDAMTIREHLEYFRKLKGVSRERSEELIEMLGISHVADHRAGSCSKGQRQRLGLAQALLSKPDLLLLDEPTVGLDPEASGFMYREIVHLRDQGCTVLVCTHELTLIEPFMNQGIVLSQGKICGLGSLDNLRNQAGLPVEISVSLCVAKEIEKTPLKTFLKGQSIWVKEEDVESAIKTLTQDLQVFDFRITRADLRKVYDSLVHKNLKDVRE